MTKRPYPILLLCLLALSAQAQSGYPVIDKASQKARDQERRVILENELQRERDALEKARGAMAASPGKEAQADVHRRAENVRALLRELGTTESIPVPSASPDQSPTRVVVRALRPAASANRPARFWNPYNRAPETTDSSTTVEKEMQ